MKRTAQHRKMKHLLMAGGIFGPLPISVEAEDADAWDKPDSQLQLYDIVEALVNARFPGVRMPILLPVGGAVLTTWHHLPDTIEGRYLAEVLDMARSGENMPTAPEALQVVNGRYLKSGLTPPGAAA